MVSEIQKETMNQINWQILARRGFRFVGMDDNTVRLNLNHKNLDITYNVGSDLYDVEKHTMNKDLTKIKSEKINGLYFDQLPETIDAFFNLKGFVQDVKGIMSFAKA